jgi:hypothetical protein
MNIPRKPTQKELDDLGRLVMIELGDRGDYFVEEELGHTAEKFLKNLVYVAVFDDFEWQDPEFTQFKDKKLLVVVWSNPDDGLPYHPDLFTWTNGQLCHLTDNFPKKWGWEK